MPRGLPVPPLSEGDRQRLGASLERLTALAPTMPAAADPALAGELRAEAAHLLAAAGVCGGNVRAAIGGEGAGPSLTGPGGAEADATGCVGGGIHK